jgi:hypothetical protein
MLIWTPASKTFKKYSSRRPGHFVCWWWLAVMRVRGIFNFKTARFAWRMGARRKKCCEKKMKECIICMGIFQLGDPINNVALEVTWSAAVVYLYRTLIYRKRHVGLNKLQATHDNCDDCNRLHLSTLSRSQQPIVSIHTSLLNRHREREDSLGDKSTILADFDGGPEVEHSTQQHEKYLCIPPLRSHVE